MKQELPVERIRDLSQRGLEGRDIEPRRQRYGANHIVEASGATLSVLARETARDPMIWFLIGTAAIYAVLAHYSESITLLVSLLPLVGMDAYLHRRTHASTQALQDLVADRARVVRDGSEQDVAAADCVVGDLAVVGAGEAFPADGIVIAGDALRADESALTGEAYPVAKQPLDPDTVRDPLVDAEHWGFAGTRLLTGRARLRIVRVGRETLYGRIVELATNAERERTPLQHAIAGLVSVLLASAVVLCVLLAIVRWRDGYGWVDAVVSAATLAVAALPEEFPVVLTVFLGVGVYRLARRKALVNRSVAVENIGRVTCICSDKTGTITEGRLRVARVVTANGNDEARTLAIAAAASRSETGDPLDRAILTAATTRPDGDVLETFPFTEDRRRETVIVRARGRVTAYTKGAPERVLAMCSDADREAWAARVTALAADGFKVIACAARELTEYAGGEPDRGFVLAGLLAVSDPIRAEVPEAIAWCRAAGIRVLMLTGDHRSTALAIARQMGLSSAPVVRSGDDLERGDVASALDGVDVVARALPSQKLAIVRALQQRGELVAVTGDGVNDVPALQAADVGIAMGGSGVRSAREVSSIVLLDDNFGSIVAAIREGRALFENLRRSFQYLLMIHIPLVLTATFIPVAGFAVLYLPIHIVWAEAIIHPTALLAFQQAGDLSPLPRNRGGKTRIFEPREWSIIASVGAIITAVVTVTYLRSEAASDEHARAMAMVALTTASAAITAALSGLRTRAAQLVVAIPMIAALVLVQTPALSTLLHLAPLHWDDWLFALTGGALAALPIMTGTRPRGASGPGVCCAPWEPGSPSPPSSSSRVPDPHRA
ncbi:MAG TPA: cation-transporting P-type ATPase [Kofleriaceae bacterium]|nr:cation-transporting P-type ATPase [Kofleriaceae bacterium]